MNARILTFPLLGLALLLAVAGCGGCRSDSAQPRAASPLAFLPPAASRALHVPDLEQVGQNVAALEKTRLAELAAAAWGAQNTEQIVRPVVQQLGFDPRKAEGFAEAGIDGKRGLAAAHTEGAELLVLGVADEKKLGGWLASVARKMGATEEKKQDWAPAADSSGIAVPPVRLGTWVGADGKVRIAWGVRDGYAVVATGEKAVEAAGAALTTPWEKSLANDPVYRRAAGKLGTRDLYLWMPRGTEVKGRRGTQFEHGLALGITASARGINARALVPRGPLELAVIEPAGKVAGGELVKLLPADHFLAIRLGGEPQALQPLVESVLPRGLLVRLRRAGIDPATEIFSQLKPGVAIGIGLSPEIDLSGGLPANASISRTNPFRFVQAAVYAKVKDPTRAAQVLEKLAAGAEHFQMEVESEEVGGTKIYRARYAAGEGMSWALQGDTLVATGGSGVLEKALQRLAAQDAPIFEVRDPGARKVFDSSASAAHLDVPRLARALHDIPESAFGVGGFQIKSVVETWIGLLGEVTGVTASFSVDGEGLVVDADVGLK